MALIRGRKLWMMYHPHEVPATLYDQLTARPMAWEWFRPALEGMAEAERPLVCMQQVGEILVLPDYWPHLTVNVGEAVGFGAQQNAIDPDDATMLYTRYKRSGRAAFELAEHIQAGRVEPRSVRGLLRRSVRPEEAVATALQKLLAVAAEGDPLELPFVAALAQLHYAQPDAPPPPPPAGTASRKQREEPVAQGPTAARAVLNSTVARLRSLVGRGYAARERVAKPIGALGSQLLGGGVDAATARELLGERIACNAPVPSLAGLLTSLPVAGQRRRMSSIPRRRRSSTSSRSR